MTRLYRPFLVLTLVFGVVMVLLGFLLESGLDAPFVADRWSFFIMEEGVQDKQQALRIAERLAQDRDRSGVINLVGGLLLIASSAWSLSQLGRRPSNQSVYGTGEDAGP